MSYKPRPSLLKSFFAGWLLAVALFILLLFWGHTALVPPPASPPAQPSATDAATNAIKVAAAPSPPIPPFDPDTAEHLITAFPLQGIQHVADAGPLINLLPPGNVLIAQVIKRDPSPELITEDITVHYALDAPYADGPNSGAAKGELRPADGAPAWETPPVSLLPYREKGGFEPYPTAGVEAADAEGNSLARTGVVLPVSTEIGCRNCHTGSWKTADKGGISPATAADMLAVHDRRNGTELSTMQGVECRSCHAGGGDIPNLSAAVHGFHATMDLEGAEACGRCHPSSENGVTQFYRGYHNMLGLDCTRCHGGMSDHAISLLRFEAENGNKAAKARLEQLKPVLVGKIDAIVPREPWVNLPRCQGCHDFKKKPDLEDSSAFNKWSADSGELFSQSWENMGVLRCPSCHGAPHAVYPAFNPSGDDRDNIQPLQYQKAAMPLGKDGNCAVCHTVPMDDFVHHERVGDDE